MEELQNALRDSGIHISSLARSVLNKIPLAGAEVETRLVNISPSELGFENKVRRVVFYTRAQERGLRPTLPCGSRSAIIVAEFGATDG